MIQQKWLQLQMKIALDDYLKIAVWWGRSETFESERFKSIKEGFFWWGKWVNFWLLGRNFSHPQVYPWRFRGRGNQSIIPGGCNNFVTFLVRREMPGIWFWEIILLRDLAVIELFQISHNCVTECTLQAKFLLKLI